MFGECPFRAPGPAVCAAETVQSLEPAVAIVDRLGDAQGIVEAVAGLDLPVPGEVIVTEAGQAEQRIESAGTVAGLVGDVQGFLEVAERLLVPVLKQVRAAQPGEGEQLAAAVADRDRGGAGPVEAAGRLFVASLRQADVAQ